MSNKFFNKPYRDKKGEVGETVTWIIATVIIIVVLLISISATVTGILDFKNFNYIKKADVLASKSFFSYLLTESDEGISVYEQLGSEDNLNEFNGVLAFGIFEEFYEKEYEDVWVGISMQAPAGKGSHAEGGTAARHRLRPDSVRVQRLHDGRQHLPADQEDHLC